MACWAQTLESPDQRWLSSAILWCWTHGPIPWWQCILFVGMIDLKSISFQHICKVNTFFSLPMHSIYRTLVTRACAARTHATRTSREKIQKFFRNRFYTWLWWPFFMPFDNSSTHTHIPNLPSALNCSTSCMNLFCPLEPTDRALPMKYSYARNFLDPNAQSYWPMIWPIALASLGLAMKLSSSRKLYSIRRFIRRKVVLLDSKRLGSSHGLRPNNGSLAEKEQHLILNWKNMKAGERFTPTHLSTNKLEHTFAYTHERGMFKKLTQGCPHMMLELDLVLIVKQQFEGSPIYRSLSSIFVQRTFWPFGQKTHRFRWTLGKHFVDHLWTVFFDFNTQNCF